MKNNSIFMESGISKDEWAAKAFMVFLLKKLCEDTGIAEPNEYWEHWERYQNNKKVNNAE